MTEIKAPTFTDITTGDTSIGVDVDFAKVEEIYANYPKARLLETPARKLAPIPMNNGGLSYYEIQPVAGYREGEVAVRILEAGNDLAPHQYASALLLAEYFDIKVIVIPHNKYSYESGERQQVRMGSLGSVARKISEAVQSITDDHDVIHGDGASLGAQLIIPTSTELSAHRDVATVTGFENPNTRMQAGRFATAFAFSKAGAEDWFEAERDAGWEGLSALFDDNEVASNSNGSFVRNFIISRELPMWLGAMSRNSLKDDVKAFFENEFTSFDASMVLGRASNSAMAAESGLREAYFAAGSSNENRIRIVNAQPLGEIGRGHAETNNPLLRVKLGALARAI